MRREKLETDESVVQKRMLLSNHSKHQACFIVSCSQDYRIGWKYIFSLQKFMQETSMWPHK